MKKGQKKGNNRISKICEVCSKEFFMYICESNKRFCSNACRYINQKENPIRYWLGKKRDSKTIEKIRLAKIGKTAWNKGLKGFRSGKGTRPNIMPLGENHWSWKGGISKDVHSPKEPKYKEWRTLVFSRDNWKCKICQTKVGLQAHHILRWAEYPELRYDVNNGITLCLAHHPRKRAEEKRLSPYFTNLVSVSKNLN